jgi:phage I-like protein
VLAFRALSSQLPDIAAGAMPREFRIFAAGVNESTKGPAIFDEKAAEAVMAAYAREGVDLMIDLEHHALDADARARADAPDARGWFKLEVRSGELWAVDVSWTPDGERRLSERTQRYISPAFEYDKTTGRVMRLLNVALVAMPATYSALPLVAASKRLAPEQRARAYLLAERFYRR